jgi:hypothetical protein
MHTQVYKLMFTYKLSAGFGKTFMTHEYVHHDPTMESGSVVSELVGVKVF